MTTRGSTGTSLESQRALHFGAAERRSLARLALYLLGTRLVLWAIGYAAVSAWHPALHYRTPDWARSPAIVGWLRWDSSWYLSIVRDGYSFDSLDPRGPANLAFLPGFPALIALMRVPFRNVTLAALVAANVSFVAAMLALWIWIRERAGVRAAERAVTWLLVYPLSFFFNLVYAESLFFLLCVLALQSADRGGWRAAGVYACLASLTRPAGIFLVVGFAWSLARARRVRPLPRDAALAVGLPGVGLAAYAAFLWVKRGSPFAVVIAQHEGWGVGRNWSLPALHVRNSVYTELLDVFHVCLPLLLVPLCVRAWRRFGPSSGVYAALATAVGVTLAGDSLGREALAVVPAFAVTGLTDFKPTLNVVLRICSLVLLAVFALGFSLANFMG